MGCQRTPVSSDAGPSAPASARSDASTARVPEVDAAAPRPVDEARPAPLPFAGFSKAGTQIGYLVPIGDPATHGDQSPTFLYSAYGKLDGNGYTRDAARFDYGELAGQVAALKKKGFAQVPTSPPDDLTIENHLGSQPPSVVLVRGSVRQSIAVATWSDVPTFGAEILGLSANGKNVAVHIGRKPGSYANTDGLHVVLIAPLPAAAP